MPDYSHLKFKIIIFLKKCSTQISNCLTSEIKMSNTFISTSYYICICTKLKKKNWNKIAVYVKLADKGLTSCSQLAAWRTAIFKWNTGGHIWKVIRRRDTLLCWHAFIVCSSSTAVTRWTPHTLAQAGRPRMNNTTGCAVAPLRRAHKRLGQNAPL